MLNRRIKERRQAERKIHDNVSVVTRCRARRVSYEVVLLPLSSVGGSTSGSSSNTQFVAPKGFFSSSFLSLCCVVLSSVRFPCLLSKELFRKWRTKQKGERRLWCLSVVALLRLQPPLCEPTRARCFFFFLLSPSLSLTSAFLFFCFTVYT